MSEAAATTTNTITNTVAIMVAVVFLLMSVYLIYAFNTWEHVAVVYNAVCAIAFSAFGVLLGSKVQEANVTRAVQTAEQAVDDARKKTAAIKEATNALLRDEEAGGGGGGKGNSGDSRRLDAIAILQRELY